MNVLETKLRAGVEAWNAYRGIMQGWHPDLVSIDLKDWDLRGYDFAGVTGLQVGQLAGANLDRATLPEDMISILGTSLPWLIASVGSVFPFVIAC